MPRIAVIGAGITGSASSFLLKQEGFDVHLYETANHIGGVICSQREQGFLSEFGPNTLLNTNEKIVKIIHDVGLDSCAIYASKESNVRYLVRDGKPQAMVQGIGFFTSPLFSWKAKLQLMLEPFRPRWNNKYEESAAQFVRRRFGREFLTYAIDSLIAGIYAGDPERLSVYHGLPKLYKAEQTYGSLIRAQFLGARERKRKGETSKQEARVVSFDGGLQVLPMALAKALGENVHLGYTLKKVQQTPNGWAITTQHGDTFRTEEFEALLITIPAYAIAHVEFDTETNANFRLFDDIFYAPVATAVIGYRRKDIQNKLNGFGFLVPTIEKLNILGTLFSSTIFPHRAPDDCVTLSTYIGGMRQPELAHLPQDHLVEMVHKDLTKLLNISGEPVYASSHYYQRAIPQFNVGYGIYKEALGKIQQSCKGLFIGGNYTRGPALSDNILASYDFCDAIKKYLRERPLKKA